MYEKSLIKFHKLEFYAILEKLKLNLKIAQKLSYKWRDRFGMLARGNRFDIVKCFSFQLVKIIYD